MIVCFLDIGGIVDHYCLKSFFVIINHERGLHFDEFRCTFQGGIYLLQILDNYVGGWTLLLIGFAECMCITYAYG
jgi:hypothetical protein